MEEGFVDLELKLCTKWCLFEDIYGVFIRRLRLDHAQSRIIWCLGAIPARLVSAVDPTASLGFACRRASY